MVAEAETKNLANWARPFFTIWSGQAVSLLGSQLVQFALIWWLTKKTGSATVLAMATLVGMLPQVVLGPMVGTLVDRWSRRKTMMLADSLIAIATIVLAVLFWYGDVQVWHIYLLMFVRSLAGGFHFAAMQASTSLMVPQQHLTRIQGLNQSLNGGMNIIAAPLGALLLEILPLQGILMIDVGTALVAISPLFFISIPQPTRSQAVNADGDQPTVWQDFREGLRYVWSWPGLVMLGLLATVVNLVLNPAFSLVPILVTKHFGGEAFHLAWMDSSAGIGIIAGGLILSAWGGFRPRILTSLFGLLGVGGATLALGLIPESGFWLAVGVTLVLGIFLPITNGPIFAVIQSVVSPDMQGRVFSFLGSAVTAMSPLGLIVAGPIADTFGVQTWFVVGGLVTVLMGVVSIFIPAILQIENGSQRKPASEVSKPALAAIQSLDSD